MTSRYGSQLLTDGLFLGYGIGSEGSFGEPESVVTSLAGFGKCASVTASVTAFAGSESVVTSLAGFAGGRRPQPPGGRTAIPAAFR